MARGREQGDSGPAAGAGASDGRFRWRPAVQASRPRRMRAEERGALWESLLGAAGAVVLGVVIVAMETESDQASDAGAWTGPVPFIAGALLLASLALPWPRPRLRAVAGAGIVLLQPFLHHAPAPWMLAAAGTVVVLWAFVQMEAPVRLVAGLLQWPLLAQVAYMAELGDGNALLLVALLSTHVALMWALLPGDGPWRTVPFSAAALGSLAAAALLAAALATRPVDATTLRLLAGLAISLLAAWAAARAFVDPRLRLAQLCAPVRLPRHAPAA